VAGTVALMLSVNNKLTPSDVDRIIKSTAVDLGTTGFDQYYGFGRVNAAAAVAGAKALVAIDTQAPVISITSPTGGKLTGVVPVDVGYSDNVGVTRVDFYVNGQLVTTDNLSPFAFSWDTTTKADGAYSLTVQAYDSAGNKGTSAPVSVTIGNDVTSPVITSFNLINGMTVAPPTQHISVSVNDNQKVTKISLLIDGREVAISYGSTLSFSWNTRKLSKGPHTVTVIAYDAAGNTVSKTVTVNR
jgi:thermitase